MATDRRMTDPVAYAKRIHASNPAVIALLAEVDAGRRRRERAQEEQPVRQRPQEMPAEPCGREPGYTWCIACQHMVPYADWPAHVAHSQAALGAKAKDAV